MPNVRRQIRRSARKYGINPRILEAQLRQESGLREGLRSPAGAQDIAQFMPATARAYGVTLGDNRTADDIDGAARYMRDNLKRTGGNYAAALSIYNSGRPDAYKDPNFAGGQTYNYVKKILGSAGTKGRQPSPGRSSAPSYQTVSQTTPGVDNSALRQQLQAGYLLDRGNPDALLSLAYGIQGAQDTPSTTTTRRVRSRTAQPAQAPQGGFDPKAFHGTADFDGKKVAAWIAPILSYARQQGWKGSVNSGFRSDAEQKRIYDSGVRPAAVPKAYGGGGSNHEGRVYPLGAIDVSEARQLARIIRRSPYARYLKYAGGKDPVHFSHPHNGSY